MICCPSCGHEESLESRAASATWHWDLAIVERSDGVRRELGFPTKEERRKANDQEWQPKRKLGQIPADAQEARVLTRHGFRSWEDIYPARQRYVVENLLKHARNVRNANVRVALEMAVLGTTEMAGLLSRWDRYYLKSYESMAAHRFNFSTLVAEPNVVGAGSHGRGTLFRRLLLLERASRWLTLNNASVVPRGPLPSTARRFKKLGKARATVVGGSSERMLLPDRSVDLIVTDPPYHDDVQYHELSLPLRAWAGLGTTRLSGEAVAIPHSNALSNHREYRGVLTRIFKEMRRVLRPDGRLLFSYANREAAAWVNVFAALRAAGFRPVGYTILHSENEHDHLKRKGRSCHLDLILELVASGKTPIRRWRPKSIFETDEERFLMAIGDAFLESGYLVNGWETDLVKQVKSEIFVIRNDRVDVQADAKIA
jgi:adenine-specific DNA methylase